jgi:hypothetical protein
MVLLWAARLIFIGFKKAKGSVKKEMLYNIFIKFCVPIKLIWLNKMYLNENYSNIDTDRHLSGSFLLKFSEERRYFVDTGFQLCFRILH